VRFIKTVQKVGLYAHLRIGPYVCAEWNFGYLLTSTLFFLARSTCLLFYGRVNASYEDFKSIPLFSLCECWI
jgi:hypothetical protein